ncbi:MAG: HDIG domain-containing protein [Clostridiales bacterium]|nr:HDIG domain-containing protein [Clostridiales bacterium]
MKNKPGLNKMLRLITYITNLVLCTVFVFLGSLPESYDYSVGSVANTDIYASKTFTDTYETEYQAIIARNSVASIFVRSSEISEKNVKDTTTFFDLTSQIRQQKLGEVTSLTEINTLKNNLLTSIGIDAPVSDLTVFLNLSDSTFSYMRDKGISIAELIMVEDVDESHLESAIDSQITNFKDANPSYSSYANAFGEILKLIMKPNSIFDSDATNEAASVAYSEAMDNPVIVEKGTKIISSGEVVTEHIYSMMVNLELIRESSFDIIILARSLLYTLILFLVGYFFTRTFSNKERKEFKVFLLLNITFVLPVAVAFYASQFSGLLAFVLFFTVICATYLGVSESVILSYANLLIMWPIYNFDIELLFVMSITILVCATIAGRRDRAYSSALIIILPSVIAISGSLIFNFFHGSTNAEYINSVLYVSISTIFSLILAIGLTPIYELVSNSASPVRLIELSQPGHPLLKRLFFEASGTYQHSLMVSNLADAAADAIGADSLLCKVACYYHDIGKLENPTYFTENQTDIANPHDSISVMESVKIITSHPEEGIKLARKYRLPEAIIKIIDEHHGTTYPAYFYRKACDEAKSNGMDMPSLENFRYKGHIPSSRESGVIMLADTCEAAIRSMKIDDINKCEEKIRELVRGKIDQDQLINSGLSFDDIEKIIIAFRQVYAGAMHERIQYPK